RAVDQIKGTRSAPRRDSPAREASALGSDGPFAVGDVELRAVCTRAERHSRDQPADGDDGLAGATNRRYESGWRHTPADSANLFYAGTIPRNRGGDRVDTARHSRQSRAVPLH